MHPAICAGRVARPVISAGAGRGNKMARPTVDEFARARVAFEAWVKTLDGQGEQVHGKRMDAARAALADPEHATSCSFGTVQNEAGDRSDECNCKGPTT